MGNRKDKLNVLLVDPLANELSHLINDDCYLAESLVPIVDNFLVATSPVSVANIKKKLKYLKIETLEIKRYSMDSRFPRLRFLRIACFLPCARYDHIIFQSFEEVSTLIFMLLHPSKRVHLIVTNNLRPDRTRRHPILGCFILRTVFKFAASVIIHCQYESDRIKKIAPAIKSEKLYIKPFHQIAFHRNVRSLQEKKRTILFIGPESTHKKVQPIIDIIMSDDKQRFHYVLCSMNNKMDAQTKAFLDAHENVDISYGYVSNEQYYRIISDACFVILTHNNDFEGALSGVFCDAIASGSPIIARNMAPHNEFFRRFGPMGVLVDYDSPGWCKTLLCPDILDRYEDFQYNMAKCRDSCNMEAIRGVFQNVLSIQ